MDTDQRYSILYVEDDPEFAQFIANFLTPHGFAVRTERDSHRAVERIINEKPEFVLLDVNLPGMDGIAICREARLQYDGPIIILSSDGNDIEEVTALEVGADDFLTKPVRPRVFVTRLKIHLRRRPMFNKGKRILNRESFKIGDLVMDESSRTVTAGGQRLDLTTAEFDLILLLGKNAGKVLSRAEIYDQIHGIAHDGAERSIDLRISRLRKKLGDSPATPFRIKSVRGVGYVMSLDP